MSGIIKSQRIRQMQFCGEVLFHSAVVLNLLFTLCMISLYLEAKTYTKGTGFMLSYYPEFLTDYPAVKYLILLGQ